MKDEERGREVVGRPPGGSPDAGRRAAGTPPAVTGSGLLPREHGAYAQLVFPLLTGLADARFHPGAVAFAAAVVALFLAHEPVAVMTGVRGARLRSALAAPARRRLALLAGAAFLALGAAAVLAPARAWLGGAVPAALALPLLPLFGRRGIKSLAAEMLVAAAFAATVVPVALCAPVPFGRAAMAAAVWLAAFVPAILAVHAIKARHKGKAEGRWTLVAAPAAAALAMLAAVAAAVRFWPWGLDALAVFPPALVVLVLGLVRPHPRHLKRIGWTLVAADTLALMLLIA